MSDWGKGRRDEQQSEEESVNGKRQMRKRPWSQYREKGESGKLFMREGKGGERKEENE